MAEAVAPESHCSSLQSHSCHESLDEVARACLRKSLEGVQQEMMIMTLEHLQQCAASCAYVCEQRLHQLHQQIMCAAARGNSHPTCCGERPEKTEPEPDPDNKGRFSGLEKFKLDKSVNLSLEHQTSVSVYPEGQSEGNFRTSVHASMQSLENRFPVETSVSTCPPEVIEFESCELRSCEDSRASAYALDDDDNDSDAVELTRRSTLIDLHHLDWKKVGKQRQSDLAEDKPLEFKRLASSSSERNCENEDEDSRLKKPTSCLRKPPSRDSMQHAKECMRKQMEASQNGMPGKVPSKSPVPPSKMRRSSSNPPAAGQAFPKGCSVNSTGSALEVSKNSRSTSKALDWKRESGRSSSSSTRVHVMDKFQDSKKEKEGSASQSIDDRGQPASENRAKKKTIETIRDQLMKQQGNDSPKLQNDGHGWGWATNLLLQTIEALESTDQNPVEMHPQASEKEEAAKKSTTRCAGPGNYHFEISASDDDEKSLSDVDDDKI